MNAKELGYLVSAADGRDSENLAIIKLKSQVLVKLINMLEKAAKKEEAAKKVKAKKLKGEKKTRR